MHGLHEKQLMRYTGRPPRKSRPPTKVAEVNYKPEILNNKERIHFQPRETWMRRWRQINNEPLRCRHEELGYAPIVQPKLSIRNE